MIRILLIDDHAETRRAIRKFLDRTEFEIEELPDGRNAIQVLRKRPFDIVLCDLFMPEKDGLEVLREIISEFGGLKIVVMSGGGFDGAVDLVPLAKRLAAAAVLRKPVTPQTLLDVIREVLSTD